MPDSSVKTPCIGICSTTSVGDSLCRGCKRFAVEVIDWNVYTAAEKRAVLQRIDQLTTQIMEPRFAIRSVAALEQGMQAAGVPCHPELSAYSWLHNLLKKRHRQITDLSAYGAALRPECAGRPVQQVWEQADAELLTLCEAHRQRYFQAG